MAQARTVEEKVADWWAAYLPIRDTLTPEAFRALSTLAGGNTENVQAINLGLSVSRIVFANDRAAATVAALITQTGIKPADIDYGD